jgi:hypothetical protein
MSFTRATAPGRRREDQGRAQTVRDDPRVDRGHLDDSGAPHRRATCREFPRHRWKVGEHFRETAADRSAMRRRAVPKPAVKANMLALVRAGGVER